MSTASQKRVEPHASSGCWLVPDENGSLHIMFGDQPPANGTRIVLSDLSTADAASGILSEYVEKEELAAQLGLNSRTLDRWDVLGTGPPRTRVGRKVFYRRESVRKWLTGREQAGANTAGVCNHGPSNRN